MPQEVRIWRINQAHSMPQKLPAAPVETEERLERWLEEDISMRADDLLVIGRQVPTDYGGYIDLLCIDSRGDIVVVELKKDRTPREVTAQILDYASWVKDLSRVRLLEIGNAYLGDHGPLDAAFQSKFAAELPDTINESHRSLIVAARMDSSTERIVRYLADAGLGLNVVTFQHFQQPDASGLLARVFLVEPSEVTEKAAVKSKRRPLLTPEQLREMAHERGVGKLYDDLVHGLSGVFILGTTQSSLNFKLRSDSNIFVVMNLIPGESSPDQGLRFQVYAARLGRLLRYDEAEVRSILPANSKSWQFGVAMGVDWSGYAGFFGTEPEVNTFVSALGRTSAG